MRCASARLLPWSAWLLSACAAAPEWSGDATAVLSRARADGRHVVVYFALPGREISDKMEATALNDAAVLAALRRGAFATLRLDGFAEQRLYAHWIGGGEGMGVCALDEQGRVYAARPGPQDPPELRAWLDLLVARRDAVADARRRCESPAATAADRFDLGMLQLELGCRIGTEELLTTAAMGGIQDAYGALARLLALDGDVARARRWLALAPATPSVRVTEGYVLFKERRHHDAVNVLDAVLRDGVPADGDRQRAQLFLGKSLHEIGRDDRAVPLLASLARAGLGSTFEAAALHTLTHIENPDHGHTH